MKRDRARENIWGDKNQKKFLNMGKETLIQVQEVQTPK